MKIKVFLLASRVIPRIGDVGGRKKRKGEERGRKGEMR